MSRERRVFEAETNDPISFHRGRFDRNYEITGIARKGRVGQ